VNRRLALLRLPRSREVPHLLLLVLELLSPRRLKKPTAPEIL